MNQMFISFGWLRAGATLFMAATPYMVTGQLPSRQFSEDLLALSVRADVRAPSYSTSGDADTTITFVAEPIPLIVAIGNHTRETIVVGSAKRHWSEALRLGVAAQRDKRVRDELAPIVSAIVGPQLLNGTEVRPGSQADVRYLLQSRNGEAPPPGRYVVSVSMGVDVLPMPVRPLRHLLTRDLQIEVKEPSTAAELADQYLHLGYRAMAAGRVAESRQWAEKVLSLNANSITALNDLGTSFLREGNCPQARPALERAVRLLTSGGDVGLRLTQSAREELAQNLQARLSTQCPR